MFRPGPIAFENRSNEPLSFFALIGKSFPYVWPSSADVNRYGASENITSVCLIKFSFLLSLLCLFLASLADLFTPIALKLAIDDLSAHPVRFPFYPILYYGISRFGSNALQQLRDVFFAYVSANTERLVALETFVHLQNLSLSFHLKRETGAILRNISRGSQSFATLLRIFLFQMIPILFQVILVCAYLFYTYDYIFSVLTGSIILFYFVFTFSTTEWRDKYRRQMNAADSNYNQISVDALLNFETVKYFNAEKHEEKRYDSALVEYTTANIRSQQSLAFLNAGQNLIISGGIVLAMYLSAKKVVDGSMSVGDFVMIQSFILTLYQPLGFLGTYYRMIKQSMVDVENMIKLLMEPQDIKDTPGAPLLILRGGSIEFQNVSFGYDAAVPILKGISFRVEAGQRVAIVGPSGAGKSTICRLIYRFYDMTGGRILVDGQDITKIQQSSLREHIAIVPQDCVLFNDTLKYNISYGAYSKNSKGPSMNEVEEAAARARLTNFVQTQPQKYDTKVGERGLRLSGGEKQRVAIARAILKQPDIMLCDEATSALDSQTELQIQEALDEVCKGKTSLTIAHRLSTIMNSDLILVLEGGEIVEQGKHQELLEKKGTYYAMWMRQQRSRELEEGLKQLEVEEARLSAKSKSALGTNSSPGSPHFSLTGSGTIGRRSKGPSQSTTPILASAITERKDQREVVLDMTKLNKAASSETSSNSSTLTTTEETEEEATESDRLLPTASSASISIDASGSSPSNSVTSISESPSSALGEYPRGSSSASNESVSRSANDIELQAKDADTPSSTNENKKKKKKGGKK